MSKKKTAKKATKAPKRKPAGKQAKPADPAPTGAAPAPPPKPTKVNISAAKGRPMLTWVGKRPLAHVTAFPAQLVERHDALRIVGIDPRSIEAHDEKMQLFQDLRNQCNNECWKDAPFINGVWAPEIGGLLFHGDNKDVLAQLLLNGYRDAVRVVYIDPPFDSGADYVRQVRLRGAKGTAKLAGDGYTLGEQIQYADIWANDNYLQFMYERLLLLKSLLADDGSVFVHLDSGRLHYMKVVLDEVFGADNFRNELIVKRRITKNLQAQFAGVKEYPQGHDTILWYSKDPQSRFAPAMTAQVRREEGYWHHFWSGEDRPTMRYTLLGVTPASGQWKWAEPRALEAVANYERYLEEGNGQALEDYWQETGEELEFIRKNEDTGKVENWFPPRDTRIANTLWTDVHAYENQKQYPTEKHEQLLERIIGFASSPGDLVLDCFIGSGTTAAVAQKLGRRWIGCDINKGAIQTTVKRLRGIIAEQIASARKAGAEARQGKLMETGAEGQQPPPKPCAFGFTVWRVNDYDLQIQHNEAVNLACEHIGIERTRSDSYFEGTLGKKLVKIIPFGHPLTPLDLEELKRELDARPDEDRNIVVVCLGMELAAKAWIDDWNRLRKGKDAVNKIDAIELRTDPKYGRFIKHEPASARVKVSRTKRGDEARIVVEIQDFISPTIVERLREQAGVLSPKIEDCRAMVDCVYIDTAYNGSVLNVALADVPERKANFVEGKYDLPAPDDETTVAVKIVDMLGEEVLVTQTV